MSEVQNEDTQSQPTESEETQVTTESSTTPQSEPSANQPLVPIISIDNLVEESDYNDDERAELEKMYEETLSEIKENEIVKGRIIAILDKEVTIDIGFKTEGSVPIEEFTNIEDLHVGEEIEVFLDTIENRDGAMVLSKQKADFARQWEKVMDYYEQDTVIEGRCIRRIKGGMVVDLMGVDAFLPGSQIDVKPVRDFDAYINKTLEFKIVKVNQLRKNIVVSRRILIEGSQEEARKKILADLERDQIREGTVKNITDFGVFIDLGGVDGLLHITDLSWGRVSHPSEVVNLDQKLKVMVLDFDDNKERISLGLKQLQPHPWENIETKYPVGAKVSGKVVSITDYGAFVELEKGIEGLIHISEMSWTQHVKHPSKIVSIGDIVEVVILSVEKEAKKISLGLKQTEPDPWLSVEEKFPVGSKHMGKVRNITNFGVFVELEEGVDGLVHISDLSWTKKIRHPSEIVKKGDDLEVVVLNISRKERRISLGHKQLQDNPWDTFQEVYKQGAITTGKIVRIIDKGAIVELPDEVEGFIPNQQLANQGDKTLKTGDEIDLVVVEFDKDQKKIVLSREEFEKAQESAEVEEYMQQQQSDKPTLADVVKTSGDTLETLTEEDSAQPAPEQQEEEQIIFEEPPPIEDEYSQPVPEAAVEQNEAPPESDVIETNQEQAEAPQDSPSDESTSEDGEDAKSSPESPSS